MNEDQLKKWEMKVCKTDTCWLWKGAIANTYGSFSINGRMLKAHRLAYEHYIGKIQDGMFLDHLCRVRHCVRPDHLEPVTNRENMRRGTAPNWLTHRSGRCRRGHSMEDAYVRKEGRRCCNICSSQRARKYQELIKNDPMKYNAKKEARKLDSRERRARIRLQNGWKGKLRPRLNEEEALRDTSNTRLAKQRIRAILKRRERKGYV